MANWSLIKKEYCSGIPPRELAKKYEITAQSISDRACRDKWRKEKNKKCEEIAKTYEKETEQCVNLAITRLIELLQKDDIRDNDLVNAIGKALDISGLKAQKLENNTTIKSGLTIEVGNNVISNN